MLAIFVLNLGIQELKGDFSANPIPKFLYSQIPQSKILT
jgi:hypothetical protein